MGLTVKNLGAKALSGVNVGVSSSVLAAWKRVAKIGRSGVQTGSRKGAEGSKCPVCEQ